MKYVVWIVIILAVAGSGYYYWQKNQAAEAPKNEEQNEQKQEEVKSGEPVKEMQEQEEEKKAPEPAAPAVQEISMQSGYPFFTPKEMTLKKGRPVKITIENSGRHTFTIDELGVNKALTDGSNVVEFTPDSAGVFIYYCVTPGHRQAGQWGTVTVEE